MYQNKLKLSESLVNYTADKVTELDTEDNALFNSGLDVEHVRVDTQELAKFYMKLYIYIFF